MSRLFAAFLLIVVLAIGGSAIAATAYQAGVTTGTAAQVVTDGSTVVTPIVVPAYGYGFHPGFGFGFLGFLATVFFIVLVFGLLRAIFWGGRHRGWGPGYGHGGPGPNGQGGWGGRERFRGTFNEWHDEAHAASGTPGHAPTGYAAPTYPTSDSTPPAPPSTPA